MVSREDIQKLCDRIVERFHPQKVILFGSYACGHPSPDSDVDLLVVMPHEGHASLQASEILKSVTPRFAVDLIVRDPATLRQRIEWEDYFLIEITQQGIVLYETADSRVG